VAACNHKHRVGTEDGGRDVGTEELPWRPLTIGELLDAAIAVFQRRAVRVLAVAVVLAGLEQLALYPIRFGMFPDPHNYLANFPHGLDARWWTLVAFGSGTEAMVIGLLGAVTAGPARQLLLARSPGACPRISLRPIATIVLSAVVGVGAFATFYAGFVPWVFWFMFTGLVTPALVNDARLGPRRPGGPVRKLSAPGAFGRSFALVGRAGLRPGAARLMAYVPLTLLRLLLAYGGVIALGEFVRVPPAVAYAIWIVVNATAYACMASVDATAHLETRMRLEGLDLELSRVLRIGAPVPDALVVPR
jgi:hypothetical protein